jgi:HRDC domain
LQRLKSLRTAFAQRLQVEPFRIFHNSTLEDIVYHSPRTLQALGEIHGIGPKKVESFGSAVLAVLLLEPSQREEHRIQKHGRHSSRAVVATTTTATATATTTTTTTTTNQPQKVRRRVIALEDSDEEEGIVAFSRAAAAAAALASPGTITTTTTTKSHPPIKNDTIEIMDDDDDDDDDDGEIAVVESLTCEQLVQQKFDHAMTHGYVISVD